jgi:pimeloyl-ACP methyl ester carboxylesterase
LNIAYREAGDAANPKLVLLHGFPSSSHQYRNLIPALADRFHVINPDYVRQQRHTRSREVLLHVRQAG